jgi:expansin
MTHRTVTPARLHPPLRRTPWRAIVLVTTLALVLGAVLAPAPSGSTAAAAATTGQATHYEAVGGGTTNGNCSFPALPANKLYVALGPTEYAAGAACGTYLDVKGPSGSVRVVVMDKCPECKPGHIDLSKTAFSKIAKLSDGLVKVSYSVVKNPPVAPLSFRFKDGSSQWWFALQVLDQGNRLKSVEVKRGSTWTATKRVDYGYWIYEPGAGPGPYSVRITDVYGQQAIASGIQMKPMTVQQTNVRLYPSARTTAYTVHTIAKVVDGDTVVTATGATVRLIGIDSPEKGQPGYTQARNHAVSFLQGKKVKVTRVFAIPNRDSKGQYYRYLSIDGNDYGFSAIKTGWTTARFDSRDGYPAHPLEARYIAADAKYNTP